MPFGDLPKEISLPMINMMTPERRNAIDGRASAFCEYLHEMINNFHESLDDNHEVGIRLVSFGQTVVFHLEYIGYQDPFLIVLKGTTEANEPVELIQHVSQISILLKKLLKIKPEKATIGFGPILDEEDSE